MRVSAVVWWQRSCAVAEFALAPTTAPRRWINIESNQANKIIALDVGKSKISVKSFNGQQLDSGGRSKSSPNGDESSPQREWSIRLDCFHGTVKESIVDFLVGGLVHERGTDAIKRRDSGSHGKSSNHTRSKDSTDILTTPSSSLADICSYCKANCKKGMRCQISFFQIT